MELTIFVLLAANILVPAIATYKSCVSHGLEINHVAVFTFGYLFYWILPITVGASQLLAYNSQLKPFYYLFNHVPPSTLNTYLVITLCFYLSFVFGHVMSRGLHYRIMEKYADLHFDSRLLIFHLVLGAAACAVYAYLLRDQLFRGYHIAAEEFADPLGIRGPFAACCNFLECVAFVYTVDLEFKLKHIAKFWDIVANRYMLVALLALLLDLSLGQRHFTLTAACMLLLYRSVFFARLGLRSALLLFVVGLGAAAAVALIRQEVSFTLVEVIFAEPMFTSLALVYFLREASFPLIRFPYLLLGDLVFIVPRVLMPNKMALMSSLPDAGIPLFNPLGTVHSFLSFMANFGVFGSFGVAFLLGFLLNVIKSGSRVPLLRVIYIMLSAQLAFSFWRDPFAFSFVKSMLEFSILIPILICASSNVLSGLVRRRDLRIARRLEEFAR